MECFQATCPSCHKHVNWISYSGTNWSTPRTYPVCRFCGTQTNASHQKIDRASSFAKAYAASIMDVLSKMSGKPDHEA